MILKPKPPLEQFIKQCTPLLKIPELEQTMRERVRAIVKELLNFQSDADPIKTLTQFIQRDENFLGVLLALTNLSQEKFLRILTAQRFAEADYGKEWGAPTIFRMAKRDETFAERIARLFLEGKNSQILATQIADFYLDQLSLPVNWSEIIRDQNLVENIVRKKLIGEYTDKKGEYVEKLIRARLDALQATYGLPYTQGQIAFLGKEVDHIIPSFEFPYVLIMTSYMETTSSSQTARANEQLTMYQKIVGENIRHGLKRVFVNVVDGAGWLARRSDLRKLHDGCDFCLSIKTLDQIDAIICQYVPAQFFTRTPKPVVTVE